MRITFDRELQQQRTDEDSKVQEIRRQADEVENSWWFKGRESIEFVFSFRKPNNFSTIERLVFKMKTIVYEKSFKIYFDKFMR